MSKFHFRKLTKSFLSVSAGMVGLALAASGAMAQNEVLPGITVEAPPPPVGYQTIPNAPIKNVARSQEVGFNDLDLRTEIGAQTLVNRVRVTARVLCRELDFEYPVGVPDGHDCYRATLDNAMYQVDTVVDTARGYNPRFARR